jgi:hypothetical protein
MIAFRMKSSVFQNLTGRKTVSSISQPDPNKDQVYLEKELFIGENKKKAVPSLA